jgi:hypothetical protein
MTALGIMGVTTPAERLTRGGVGALFTLGAASSPHHHIDLPAAASGTDQPTAPTDNRRFGTVLSSHIRGIGFDLMAAIVAPHDQPHVSRSGIAERHRRGGTRFHRLQIILRGMPLELI